MDVRYSSSLLVLFVQQVLWQAGPRSPTTSSASLQGTCTSKPRLYGAPLTALGRSEEKPPAKREWPRMNRLQHLLVPFQRAAPRNLRNRPKNSRSESEKVLARIVRRYTSGHSVSLPLRCNSAFARTPGRVPCGRWRN